MAEKTTIAALDYRQLSTVLAALRIIQEGNRDVLEAMDHFADCDPLTDAEIDELCEALNVSGPARAVVDMTGGVFQGGSSTIPLDVIVLDYDARGYGDADQEARMFDIPQSVGGTEEAEALTGEIETAPDWVDSVFTAIAGQGGAREAAE